MGELSWDAYTRGGFAIVPHMYAPVIGKVAASMKTKCLLSNKQLYL